MDLRTLCTEICDLARTAGQAILEVYQTSFVVDYKDDQSPLTKADKVANDIICMGLRTLTPEIPIVSEENKQADYSIRKEWEYLWLVDPLDGTKEFVNRNGDFTVNIALVQGNAPILGVVFVPVTSDMYWGWFGGGAWKEQFSTDALAAVHSASEYSITRLQVSQFDTTSSGVRIVTSRSHNTPETEAYINTFCNPVVKYRGSSLKLLMVAEGEADVYPRIAPTMEWDTAAADIIVRQAGGQVLQYGSSQELQYNKANLLNPSFLVCGEIKLKN